MSYQLQSQNYSLQPKNLIEKKYRRAKRGHRWERPQKIKTNCFYYKVFHTIIQRRSGTQLRDPRKSHRGFFNLAIQAKIICPYTLISTSFWLANPDSTNVLEKSLSHKEFTRGTKKIWKNLLGRELNFD